MEIPESNIKFICGLSNGETLVEGKDKLNKVGDSPWIKLQKYIKENNLTIQSLGLWVGDRHYNLPSKNPKFGGEVPVAYNCKRYFASDGGGENVEHYILAEAIYENFIVQIVIDEQDNNKMWCNINAKRER